MGSFKMKSRVMIAAAFTLIASAALGADEVVGTWKTQSGEISIIERCGVRLAPLKA
jgi:uncharacterized protein (DUF2147 family)